MNQLKITSLSLVLLLAGCSSIQPGNDKLLVRAEQTREAAVETFDTFVKYEYGNREALWKVSKDIKHTADHIRSTGKESLKALDEAIDEYKVIRSTASGDKLNSQITFVASLTTKAFNAMAQGKAALTTSNKK